MSDEIKPALTAEEWKPPEKDGWEATGPRSGDEAWIENGAVWLPERRDGEEIVQNPHGLAALCLYQQPFGFTHEDVESIGAMIVERAMPWEPGELERHVTRLQSLADRIAALLPPEKP